MSEDTKAFPTAVPAPDSDVTPLSLSMLAELIQLSRQSPRMRMIQCIHKGDEAKVHRMFNCLQPGTYITPHRHMDPAKSETVLLISGSMLYVEFTEEGEVQNQQLVQPGTEVFGLDIAPHVYHTFVALKPDTIMFEIKDGPFAPTSDKDIPQWAPGEGTEEANTFLLNLLKELAERTNAAVQKDGDDEPGEPAAE